MLNRNEKLFLGSASIIYALFLLCVQDHVFFWDTIQLSSRQAHFFFENGYQSLQLPIEIDSGHPPFMGLYLSSLWKIFGKSLAVSHWAMFPFIIGILFQSFFLIKYFIKSTLVIPASILFLVDPGILAQMSLVSPDIILLFFFILGINAILYEKKIFLILSVSGLAVISNRGMSIAAAVYIFHILHLLLTQKLNFYKTIKATLLYVPGGIIALLFLVYHYRHTGWIGFHQNMPWAGLFERADSYGIIYNMATLIWRMIDFGRLTLYLIALFILIKWRKKINFKQPFKTSALLFLITFILSLPTFLLYTGLTGHRYLIPAIAMASLLYLVLIENTPMQMGLKKALIYISILGLLAGNFIVYPIKISTGWDATLAHLPYYKLRNDMLQYIDNNNIKPEEVAASFPAAGKFKYIALSDDDKKLGEVGIDTCKYLLYSNIFNTFSDAEIDSIFQNGKLRYECKSGQVIMRLYEF